MSPTGASMQSLGRSSEVSKRGATEAKEWQESQTCYREEYDEYGKGLQSELKTLDSSVSPHRREILE